MQVVYEKCYGINHKITLILTGFYSIGGRRDSDRMVVGFTTTYAISAYRH
jgi:hypothetical protein